MHAPSPRRERVILYADRGGGKTSVVSSIADWLVRTHSDRRIHLLATGRDWEANRSEDGTLDSVVQVINLDRDGFGGREGWANRTRSLRPSIHPDDWVVTDLHSEAWQAAQSYYWGQKSGDDSLAELWLRYSAQDIAGDHGANWGVINKFYFEWHNQIVNMPCHVVMLASATELREPGKTGKGGDSLDTRNFYGKVGYKMEGQKDLRGDGHTVIYAFEANGTYRYTTVKERGPIGGGKRRLLVNEDVSEKGFVGGYLIPVAGWRP